MGNALPRNNNVTRAGFEDNKTVFGAILRGELPADILYEDERVLCFRDIKPMTEHHILVIPKQHIEHPASVVSDDVPLLRHMETVALDTLQAQYPAIDARAAHAAGTASMGYHRWPFLTVWHLHLHCIYPMPISWSKPMARTLSFREGGPFYAPSAAIIAHAEATAPSSGSRL